MKKTLLFLLIWAAGHVLWAQPELKKTSLSPLGAAGMQNASLQMIAAGGEIFNAETEVSSLHLSEGFVGPDIAHMLGVADYTTLTGVNVFPNPVRTDLHVELPAGDVREIYLHDLTGREVYRYLADEDRVVIPVKDLRVGIYLLTVVDRQRRQTVSYKIQKIK